jgi:hypothetical protein
MPLATSIAVTLGRFFMPVKRESLRRNTAVEEWGLYFFNFGHVRATNINACPPQRIWTCCCYPAAVWRELEDGVCGVLLR